MGKLLNALKDARTGYKVSKEIRESTIDDRPDEHLRHPVALFFALIITFLVIYLWGLPGVVIGIIVVLLTDYLLTRYQQ